MNGNVDEYGNAESQVYRRDQHFLVDKEVDLFLDHQNHFAVLDYFNCRKKILYQCFQGMKKLF